MNTNPSPKTINEFRGAIRALGEHIREESRTTPADIQALLEVGQRTARILRPVAHLGAMVLPTHPQSLGENTSGRDIGVLLSNSQPDPMRFDELSPAYVYPIHTMPAGLNERYYKFALPMEGSVACFSCAYYDATPEQRSSNPRLDTVNFSVTKYTVDPEKDLMQGAAEAMLVGKRLAEYYGDENQLFANGEYATAESDIQAAHKDFLRATGLVLHGFVAATS